MNLQSAQRLYEYRKNANLSQEELAEKIGVSRQAVSKWERGEASPDTDNLIALSEVYGVTLDELVKGKKLIMMLNLTHRNPKAKLTKTKIMSISLLKTVYTLLTKTAKRFMSISMACT